MKTKLILLILLIPQALHSQYNIVYDSSGNVKEFGYQNTDKQIENGNFTMQVKEDHPLLLEKIAYLKITNGTLTKKSDTEIQKLKNKERLFEIKNQIIQKYNELSVNMFLSKEGYEVSIETTTLRNEINILLIHSIKRNFRRRGFE